MNQKGMEMAIQIFIVLFVLLAVSMLVLQLVSTQFTEQESKLKDVQRKAAFDQQMSKNRSECESLCNMGTLEEKAKFCIKNFNFSQDETLSNYNQEDFIAGVGVCEDRVYCNMITTCKSGNQVLDMQTCKIILCNYWASKAGDEKKEALLKQFIKPGACYDNLTPEQKELHWYKLYFNENPSCEN